MGLNVFGKITMFAREKQHNGENFYIYTTNLTREYQDTGKRISKSLQVFFDSRKYPADSLSFNEDYCYSLKVKSGFISVRHYFNGSGDEVVELCLQISDYEVLSITPIDKGKREKAREVAAVQREAPDNVPSPMAPESIDSLMEDLPL